MRVFFFGCAFLGLQMGKPGLQSIVLELVRLQLDLTVTQVPQPFLLPVST